jgi:hypothetical protein
MLSAVNNLLLQAMRALTGAFLFSIETGKHVILCRLAAPSGQVMGGAAQEVVGTSRRHTYATTYHLTMHRLHVPITDDSVQCGIFATSYHQTPI